MLLQIAEVMTKEKVQVCRQWLQQAEWVGGGVTAGQQSAQVKNNLQLPEHGPVAKELQTLVLESLAMNATFFSAALPSRIFPPLFNCYTGSSNHFGNHVDNAVRTIAFSGERVRSDVSATLFLSEPDEYDGGELVIEDTFGEQRIKLPAGHMVLYPSSSVHRVEPVTRGARLASFMWIESMVRADEQRRLLYEMDMAICNLRRREAESCGDTGAADSAEAVRLTGCYHNLLRMWANTR